MILFILNNRIGKKFSPKKLRGSCVIKREEAKGELKLRIKRKGAKIAKGELQHRIKRKGAKMQRSQRGSKGKQRVNFSFEEYIPHAGRI
jgi:hypothetical protein